MEDNQILANFNKRYQLVENNPGIWRITVHKIRVTVPKTITKKSFDRIYWDQESVSDAELLKYLEETGYPLAYPFDSSGKPIKNITRVVKPVTQLTTKLIKRKKGN